ncbi:hypothetical protein B0H14DRAFT_3450255 [Mycena olivaceomarginata]|nr:hypothetical protein B0H14DRAFT_3517641 [Mycena olivaceomarginata]KAJ7853584.1 hypothetical protein B0H14DRAFT_3450255 [Mycena olivaceomarginata]
MARKSSSTAHKSTTTDELPARKKAGAKKSLSAATMAARRQASARYRQRNLEEEREKARERMARCLIDCRHRQKIQDDEDLAREFRARAREASKTYRHRNAAMLAHRQRIIRMEHSEHSTRSTDIALGWSAAPSWKRACSGPELEEDLHQREELRRIEKEFEREQR